jgi:uncharacterized protein YbgA (DUF1722 family)/uncharacterized protein YbbK (DUF523 family)
MPPRKLRVGVSSCLLGQRVRWDGQHRRDAFLVDVLGPFVEWVPVCPELEVGMGVPREPIRLVGDPRAPRLVGERSAQDHTTAMLRFAAARVRDLAALGLAGYVTKRDSPSCGLERVRVHGGRGGPPRREGTGLFARVLRNKLPLLPIEEEAALRDPAVRESFLERVFAYARWSATVAKGARRGDLVAFHAAHELELLAHSPAAQRRLATLVRSQARRPLGRTVEAYGRGLMEALRVPTTRGRHASVLQHMLGELRGLLDARDRTELAEAVADYARGRAPLVVPLTLFRHHARRHRVAALAGQTYLEPDPRELVLRNHA